jgi:hypothetical protein
MYIFIDPTSERHLRQTLRLGFPMEIVNSLYIGTYFYFLFRIAGVGSGLVTISRWLLGFLVTIVFGDLMSGLGEDGAYWLFAFLCLMGAFYVYFFVPETKGRTLDEIQLYFLSSVPEEENRTGDVSGVNI